jgi:hypothetical protein
MEHKKNKCLYGEGKNGAFWFADWKFYRPVFFTGNLNRYYQYGDRLKVLKNNEEFLEILHSKVFKKSAKEITRIVSVEKGTLRKLHTHLIIDTPEHLSTDIFLRFLKQSWLNTRGGTDCFIKSKGQVFDVIGLGEYLGKQQNLKSDLGIDEMNSYTNESVSLTS